MWWTEPIREKCAFLSRCRPFQLVLTVCVSHQVSSEGLNDLHHQQMPPENQNFSTPSRHKTPRLLPLTRPSKTFLTIKSQFPHYSHSFTAAVLRRGWGPNVLLHRRYSGVRGLLVHGWMGPSSSEQEQDSLLCPGSGSSRDLWPVKDLRSLAGDLSYHPLNI